MITVPNDGGNFGLYSRLSGSSTINARKECCTINIFLLIPEVTEAKHNYVYVKALPLRLSLNRNPNISFRNSSVTHTRVSNGGKHAPTLVEVN